MQHVVLAAAGRPQHRSVVERLGQPEIIEHITMKYRKKMLIFSGGFNFMQSVIQYLKFDF